MGFLVYPYLTVSYPKKSFISTEVNADPENIIKTYPLLGIVELDLGRNAEVLLGYLIKPRTSPWGRFCAYKFDQFLYCCPDEVPTNTYNDCANFVLN